jgi:ectoine hydroxylase
VYVATETLTEARSAYDRQGWFRAPELMGEEMLATIRTAVEAISGQERPEVVYEDGTDVVRAIHGCHAFDDVCARLVRLPALVDLAEALVGEPVYVYQFKVNMKQPWEGRAWPWHQDFTFWSREDGMPAPDAVNIAVFLDDTHDKNGPLQVIPGSHRIGIVGEDGGATGATGDWRMHVSANLGHTVSADAAAALERSLGRQQIVGPAGTVCAFHPSIVHSSSNNASDDRRALLLITYNAVRNAPENPTRPEFLVNRDTTPVARLASSAL